MNDRYQKIASICVKPSLIEDIAAGAGVTKRAIYNLVARGMLVNVGTGSRALYVMNDNVAIEKERVFKTLRAIEQVSSVWEYAHRCQQEARHV